MQQPATFVEWIARNRGTVGKLLLVLGALLAGVAIFSAYREAFAHSQAEAEAEKQKREAIEREKQKSPALEPETKAENKGPAIGSYLPLAIVSALLALLAFGAGGVLIVQRPEAGKEVYETRIAMIVSGGAAGLLTALLGFMYAVRWQQSIILWVNNGDLHEARWVILALAVFLAGLALIFVSMLPVRGEERNSVVLRRLLYGTNTVLTGILVLLLLTVVNVIVFLKLPENVITTAAGFKGLSRTSIDFLKTIKEPVHVYLIMPQDHIVVFDQERYGSLYADCKSLLDAVETDNDNIKVTYLYPSTDDAEIRRLMSRYKVPENQRGLYGMLVVFGDSEEASEFVGDREMVGWDTPDRRSRVPIPSFQGENRLMTELNFLSGGAKRPVVYFTQGHGEPSITEPAKQGDRRTALLVVDYLKSLKFDVKPLQLGDGKPPDFSDATTVVVAAPTKPFDPQSAQVLQRYMTNRPKGPHGTLVAMLPAFPNVVDGKVSSTGLESLMLNMKVRLDDGHRLFAFRNPQFARFSPVLVPSILSPDVRGSEFNRSLPENAALLLNNVRPVRVERDPPSEIYTGFNLFVSFDKTYRDDKYLSNPDDIAMQIEMEKKEKKLETASEKQVSDVPVTIGVVVAETIGEGDNKSQRPCAVIVGTDSFINDDVVKQQPGAEAKLKLMGQFLSVLRGRPQGMDIAPRNLGTFELPQKHDNVILLYLPFAVIILGIAALGMGVWYIRRT